MVGQQKREMPPSEAMAGWGKGNQVSLSVLPETYDSGQVTTKTLGIFPIKLRG